MKQSTSIPVVLRSITFWIGLAVMVAFLSALVVAVIALRNFQHRLAAEYTAARVIRDTGEFVESHNGKWPAGWADLPDSENAARYVNMEFNVDTRKLIDDPELIHTVIVPVTMTYSIYPHAHADLENLREILRRSSLKAESGQTNRPNRRRHERLPRTARAW